MTNPSICFEVPGFFKATVNKLTSSKQTFVKNGFSVRLKTKTSSFKSCYSKREGKEKICNLLLFDSLMPLLLIFCD